MAEVFVNYRTGDGDEVANLIVHYLSDRFGAGHVFKASRSIPAGAEYRSALIAAVRACDVLLAVIGPNWPRSERLREDDDWVRREILEAFAAGKTVIPVLHGRKTDQLHVSDLPQELARLAYIQSRRIDTRSSEVDLKQIGQAVLDLVPSLKAADRWVDEPVAPGTTNNSAIDVSGAVVQSGSIRGDVVNVSRADGPTQVGDGSTQYNFLAARRKPVQPRLQSVELLRKLVDRFIPPPGFDIAAAALIEPGILILDGPPGTGRTAAATMILFASWSRTGRLHELEPQDIGEESSFHLNPDAIGPDDGVWVDLSDAEPRLWIDIQRELQTLHARVLECCARLVVIQPHGEQPRSDFHELRRTIGTMAPVVVFHHLLRAEGLLNGEGPALPALLAGQPSIAAIRQIVDDVLKARDEAVGSGSLADWIAGAVERASPREEHVKAALRELPRAPQRAVLLSAAMLHGAHADVIEQAATNLLVNIQDEDDSALKRSPLGDRLHEVGAAPDTRGCVRFTRPGYDFAVRAFFWRHFPELHDATADLVRRTLDSKVLNSDQAEDLVRGFTDQCLEGRYQSFWKDLVEHLTQGDTDLTRVAAAAAVLQRGLSDKKSAQTFRQQVYRWSRGRIPDSLAAVLVTACDEMSYTNPDEAIVRLHHLARRHQEVGARNALAALARSDPLLLSLLLSRLTSLTIRSPQEMRWVDARIFLDIAEATLFTSSWSTSGPLIAQTQMASQLVAGWALAFRRLEYEDWALPVHDWFRRAAEDDANRHLLLDVLVNGTRRRVDLLSELFSIAHHAAFRDVISDLLIKKISAAQGIELI